MTDDTQQYVMRLLKRAQVVRVGPNRESALKLAKAWSGRYDAATVECEGDPEPPEVVFIDGVAFRRADREGE